MEEGKLAEWFRAQDLNKWIPGVLSSSPTPTTMISVHIEMQRRCFQEGILTINKRYEMCCLKSKPEMAERK